MADSERFVRLEYDGSVPVTIVSGGGTGGTASSFGAPFPPTGTAAGFIDASGNMAGGTLDASGFLKVNVAAGGGSGGTSSTFGAAFPATGTAAGFIDSGGNMAGANLDASGFLKVNVAAGSSGNAAASATGSAVPASADYQGVNVAGNLRGVTGVNSSGSVFSPQQDLASVAGATVKTGNGTAAGSIRVALPTDGTGVVGLIAGTAVIGHVITDSGSTTAVTGNVTVVQSTATSLNAAVVGTGTAGSAAGGILTVQGVASMTKLLVTPDSVALPANQSVNVNQLAGTTTDTNSGNKSAGTLRVVIATDQPQLTNKLLVTPDANSAINLAQVGGTNTVNGGLAGSQSVGGTVATNVAISANPINLGAQAVSAENTAVTATRQVQLVADLAGKLIVLLYANPENFVSGAITSAMTGTTSTSLIAAPASGLRNYITQVTVTNSHATVGTDIVLQDGSGGTTLYTIPAAAVYGGATLSFPTPLRQPTTATALFCANVTTGASTKVSASGYKGA